MNEQMPIAERDDIPVVAVEAAPGKVLPQGEEPVSPAPVAPLPEWLVRLATESWQAELLISGFAIVSTFQLVGLITPLIEWAIFNLRAELLDYVRWAIYYASLGVMALPAVFVAHFALRTYWVGLVGLSSVYPHGFGKNYGMIPEWVVADTARRHPPLATQIDRIDRRSSVMFALAALAAMTFVSIAAVVTVMLTFSVIVEAVTDGAVGFKLVFKAGLGCLFLAYVVHVVMLSLKRYHHLEKFRAVHLTIARGFTRGMYTFFTGPASYLSTLMTTNATGKAALGPAVLGLLFLMLAVTYQMSQPLTLYLLDPGRVLEVALRTDMHDSGRYQDQWVADAVPTLVPSVPSEIVDADAAFLPIFFPLTGDEAYRIDARYPEPERPETVEKEAWRPLRRAEYIQRAGRYFRIRLGERELPVEELARIQPAGQRDGLRFTVRLPDGLALGRHYLYLDRRATLDPADTSWAARAVIPVWVDGTKAPIDE